MWREGDDDFWVLVGDESLYVSDEQFYEGDEQCYEGDELIMSVMNSAIMVKKLD